MRWSVRDASVPQALRRQLRPRQCVLFPTYRSLVCATDKTIPNSIALISMVRRSVSNGTDAGADRETAHRAASSARACSSAPPRAVRPFSPSRSSTHVVLIQSGGRSEYGWFPRAPPCFCARRRARVGDDDLAVRAISSPHLRSDPHSHSTRYRPPSGEMISHLPLAGGHVTLASRLVDPAFGLAVGWTYAANWLLVLPAELAAAATLISFWSNAKCVLLRSRGPSYQGCPHPAQSVTLTRFMRSQPRRVHRRSLGHRHTHQRRRDSCLWRARVLVRGGASPSHSCSLHPQAELKRLLQIKIITIIGLLILSIVITSGGVPNTE